MNTFTRTDRQDFPIDAETARVLAREDGVKDEITETEYDALLRKLQVVPF